jgi:hypothetical protein
MDLLDNFAGLFTMANLKAVEQPRLKKLASHI